MVELMGLLQLEGLPEAQSIDFNKGKVCISMIFL